MTIYEWMDFAGTTESGQKFWRMRNYTNARTFNKFARAAQEDAFRSAFATMLDGDFDAWRQDVITGKLDRDFLDFRNQIADKTLLEFKDALRRQMQAEHPTSPQPSPASKAETTVKPHGVSYSIHVDNVHNAVALSWIASVMNEQGVYDSALNSLAMIVDNITEQYSVDQSTPEADEDAILSMKRLIEKIRKANQ